ncbi:MAG: hypothetical protein QOG56_406 [Solirubrobacteraceae bacterium]|nr:hypothetical protein [Solirubrobacteraceae bacterium]
MTFVDGSAPPAFLGRDAASHAPVVDGRTPILAERRGVAHDCVVVEEALDRDFAGAGFKLRP